MPFADGRRSVTGILKHISHRIAFGTDNHPCIACCNISARTTPGIFSGKHRVTRRSTGSSRSMRIVKANTFSCQTVYIRSLHILCTITLQVAITEVVGIDKHDIRKLPIIDFLLGFSSLLTGSSHQACYRRETSQ